MPLTRRRPRLDRIFRTARTHRAWTARPVTDETLRAIYELMKWGPTSVQLLPGADRVREEPARPRSGCGPRWMPETWRQTMAAPATAIVAYDLEFYEKLPRSFLTAMREAHFVGKPELVRTTAMQSGTLQGAYLIIAARALGLDCGPMGGFDSARVDAKFFPDGKVRSNFLCNLGYGDPAKLHARAPRLAFDDACRIL